MFGLRSTARRAVPFATRAGGLTAVLAAVALSSVACGSDLEESSSPQDASASSVPSPGSDESAAPDAGAGSESDSATAEPSSDELLTEREISEVLLTPVELPFTPDSHSTLTGLDFFEDQLGSVAEVYTESFGESECTSAMDRINADLVGESPQSGVVQEYQHEQDDRTESLYVWMLGLQDPPESSVIWDRVIEACTAQPLRGETDSVDFAAFDSHDFRGLELTMDVQTGAGMTEVNGFSASTDYGRHLLMISAANMQAETFQQVVERQAEKLSTFDHRRAD